MSKVQYEVKMHGDANGIQMSMYGVGENCRLEIKKNTDGDHIKHIIVPIETIFNYVKIHAELEDKIMEKDRVIKAKDEKINKLDAEIKDLQELRNDDFGELVAKAGKIESLEKQIKEKDEVIEDLEDRILSQEITIKNLRDYIKEKNSKIDALDDLAKVQGEIIAKHRDEIAKLRTTIKAKDNGAKEALNNKDVEIASLKKRLNMLYGVQSSDPYKMILKDAEIAFKDGIIDDKNKEVEQLKAENERLKSGVDKAIDDLNNLNTK